MALYIVFAQALSDLIAPRHSDHRTLITIMQRNLVEKYKSDKVWHLDRTFVLEYCPWHNTWEPGYDGSTVKGALNNALQLSNMEYKVYGAFVPEDNITWDLKHVTLRGTDVKTLEVFELIPAMTVLHIVLETESRVVVEKLCEACRSGKLIQLGGRERRGYGTIKILSVAQLMGRELKVLEGIQNPVQYMEEVNKKLAHEVIKQILEQRRKEKEERKKAVREAQAKAAQKPQQPKS